VKINELKRIIKEEIGKFFLTREYSLEEELILENEIYLSELLDPEDYYEYEGGKGLYTYKDSNEDEFFVRLAYTPLTTKSYFELKTGWIGKNGRPVYEPSIPPYSPKASAIYLQKRSNTVAKIYKDEIVPFLKKQTLADTMVVKPISDSRKRFAQMLLKKFTPSEDFNVDLENLIVVKK
jgi:hypothetical protein